VYLLCVMELMWFSSHMFASFSKSRCFPAPEQIRMLLKKPAVLLLFLTPEVLAQKDLAKAFEFLRFKDEACPKPLLVLVGSGQRGENLNPNTEAVQVLQQHVKRLYKLDIKDSFISWDSSKIEQSAQLLRSQVEQLSLSYYQSQAGDLKKVLKGLRKSVRSPDVFAFVRGSFIAGLYGEFQRSPADALVSYKEAFEQLRVPQGPFSSEEVEQMSTAVSMLSYKIWTLLLVLQRESELKKHFADAVGMFRKWVAGSAPLVQMWAQEWLSCLHVVAAELLTAPNMDLQLNSFYYLCEAVQCLRNARQVCEKFRVGDAGAYEGRITVLLSKAYSEARALPIAVKRAKIRVGVMLAEEANRAGRHAEALELCQRISNPQNNSQSRYKSESWWSLLGVVDFVAAKSAKELEHFSVALNHALRCLSPAALAPAKVKNQLVELVLELRHRVEEPPLEWCMNENSADALVAIEVAFEKDAALLGSLVAGTISFCSHLPISIAFDDVVISTSRSNIKPFLDKAFFPLTLKPNDTKSLPFACRAPSATLCTVKVETASLVLGKILFTKDFDMSVRKPFFAAVKVEEEPQQLVTDDDAAAAAAAAAAAISAPAALPIVALPTRTSSQALSRTSSRQSSGRRLTVESGTGVVDCYGQHLNVAEFGPALETLRGGLTVRGLELGSNNLGNDGCALVASWLTGGAAPQLNSLSLWNCNLGPQCGAHIVTVLRSCPALRVLNLGLNRIGDGGVAAFARSLQIAPALEELVLWRINMTRTGLIVLTENLLPPSRVRVLDIRSNELTEGSENVLSQFLAKNTSLQQCLVADNPGLSNPVLKDLAASIGQVNFSVLSFGEEVDCKALVDVSKRNNDVAEMLRMGSLALPFKGLSMVPSILLQSTGSGKRITHLDVSHNQINVLPAELGQLENLSHLILSHNNLVEIPSDVARLRNLTFMDVSHNSISYLPTELGMLSRLSHLMASNNSLQSLVPELFNGAAPVCASMKELDLSFNHMTSLPATLANLRGLQVLNVSNNQIGDVFNGLSRMLANGLRVCNLSNNLLQTLPPPFSVHRKIINISHNPFVQFPAEVVTRGTTAVWDYLEDMLHGQQICPRMKLMFVGQGNVGKTTLLKALTGKVDTKTKVMGFVTGKGVRKQTDGIEVDEWAPEDDLTFSTWDFAGQEVYYNTHQFFLSQRSLYLVVFSLAMPLQETNILTWLNSLQVRAPGVSVLIIGTHADKKPNSQLSDVSEKLKVAIAKWSKLYKKEGRIVIVKPTGD
jgi:small GTP-binding protein